MTKLRLQFIFGHFLRYNSVVFALLLSACASHIEPSINNHTASLSNVPADWQLPILPPKDWGQNLSAQQVLSIEAGGQTHQVQAILDISPQAVHLAVVKMGRRMVTIEHSARGIQVQKDHYAPDFLNAQQILQDIQLVYAPLAKLQTILPEACIMSERMESPHPQPAQVQVRELWCHSELIYRIRSESFDQHREYARSTQLHNIRQSYRIQIDTLKAVP